MVAVTAQLCQEPPEARGPRGGPVRVMLVVEVDKPKVARPPERTQLPGRPTPTHTSVPRASPKSTVPHAEARTPTAPMTVAPLRHWSGCYATARCSSP